MPEPKHENAEGVRIMVSWQFRGCEMNMNSQLLRAICVSRPWHLVCSAILLWVLQVSAHGNDQQNTVFEEIGKAWALNAEKVKSVEFVLTVRETFAKGYFSDPILNVARGRAYKGPPLPQEDTTIVSTFRYALDAGRFSSESERTKWVMPFNTFIESSEKEVFNGKEFRGFQLRKRLKTYPKQGVIGKGRPTPDLVYHMPLTYCLGKLWNRWPEIEKSTVSQEEDSVGLYKVQTVDGIQIWVDQSRNFVPVKLAKVNKAKDWQIDVIEYENNNSVWFPSKWNATFL